MREIPTPRRSRDAASTAHIRSRRGKTALASYVSRSADIARAACNLGAVRAVSFGGRVQVHKSVSIVSINYAPEMTGIGVYSTGMARFLARCGYQVVVHTGFPYYPHWRKREADRRALFREEIDQEVRLRRSFLYVPRRPTALRRILHELSFTLSAAASYLLGPRAAITIIVSPPLLLGLAIGLLARLKGSRILFHVQDLQPDAAIDLGMIRNPALVRVLRLIERQAYGLADRVSTISMAMLQRLEARGVPRARLRLFRNWANDDVVSPVETDTGLRSQWGLEGKTVVLYSGNMGVKQGLETLIEAAHELRAELDIVFLIVGDGGEKGNLMALAERLGLHNVRFFPLQPAAALSDLLGTADIAVIPQRQGVTDIVLPSKVGNLLASARPVIAAAQPHTDLHDLIGEAKCGLVVPPGDGKTLARAIRSLGRAPATRRALGHNGRVYMESRLSSTCVLTEFENWLDDWITSESVTGKPEPQSLV